MGLIILRCVLDIINLSFFLRDFLFLVRNLLPIRSGFFFVILKGVILVSIVSTMKCFLCGYSGHNKHWLV